MRALGWQGSFIWSCVTDADLGKNKTDAVVQKGIWSRASENQLSHRVLQ